MIASSRRLENAILTEICNGGKLPNAELAAQDRSRGEQFPTVRGQTSQPLTDHLSDGVRKLAATASLIQRLLEPSLGVQQPDDLTDEQRIALSLGVDRMSDVVRDLAPGDRVDHGRRVGDAQPGQLDPPRRGLARESRKACAQLPVLAGLIVAIQPGKHHRYVLELPGEELQQQ